jgi:hypothetical protein
MWTTEGAGRPMSSARRPTRSIGRLPPSSPCVGAWCLQGRRVSLAACCSPSAASQSGACPDRAGRGVGRSGRTVARHSHRRCSSLHTAAGGAPRTALRLYTSDLVHGARHRRQERGPRGPSIRSPLRWGWSPLRQRLVLVFAGAVCRAWSTSAAHAHPGEPDDSSVEAARTSETRNLSHRSRSLNFRGHAG